MRMNPTKATMNNMTWAVKYPQPNSVSRAWSKLNPIQIERMIKMPQATSTIQRSTAVYFWTIVVVGL